MSDYRKSYRQSKHYTVPCPPKSSSSLFSTIQSYKDNDSVGASSKPLITSFVIFAVIVLVEVQFTPASSDHVTSSIPIIADTSLESSSSPLFNSSLINTVLNEGLKLYEYSEVVCNAANDKNSPSNLPASLTPILIIFKGLADKASLLVTKNISTVAESPRLKETSVMGALCNSLSIKICFVVSIKSCIH